MNCSTVKIAIVTSSEFSYASELLSEKLPVDIEPVLIVNQPQPRPLTKVLKKILRVGILGVLIGYFARKWYRIEFKSVLLIAKKKNIPTYSVHDFRLNSDLAQVIENCSIGISMGNGYIPERFFKLFKNGMINIHHEILPDYAGAQSVVWPIIRNELETGFSIHFLSRNIDKGDIVVVKKRPILFKSSLKETVHNNYAESLRLSILEILQLLAMPIENWGRIPNRVKENYTTPTFLEWLAAFLNHSHKNKKLTRD